MAQSISDNQRELNMALHRDDDRFGNRADGAGLATKLPAALVRMHELGVCTSILDYGTGKGRLVERLKIELPQSIVVEGYDPAVETYATKPTRTFDVLTCLDVLEHIEPEYIDNVISDIKALTNNFCYLVIDLQPAVKTLADGRNAHILLAPMDWWINKFSQKFPCISAFPIYHLAGPAQRLVIVCSHKTSLIPYMNGFLTKLSLYETKMSGGVLAGMIKQ